jgi:hypothetical protein
MKYINKTNALLLIILSLVTYSCKDKLDLVPYASINSSSAFLTAERCSLALNGVYDAAQSGVYDPLNGTATSDRGYPFGAAAIEQQDMRGEDMVNTATFYAVTYQSTYNTVTPNNVNMWKELYALINKANICIEGFRTAAAASVLSGPVAAQYEAECRFLRAMAHHELLIHFARPYSEGNGSALGVPYRDFAIQSSTAMELAKTKPRESVADVYTKILADLDYAETNLLALFPTSGNLAENSTFRATKAAAIAVKMRVKLHKGDMPGVIAEGNKLIPATVTPTNWAGVVSPIGAWAMTAAVDGAFTNNLSKENIFSIRHDQNDNPNTNAALARMYGPNAGGGRGLVSISPIIWNDPQWLCDDKRRTTLVIDGPISATAVNNAKFTFKYKDYTFMTDFAPYIRYTEVLLMQAEAEARNAAGVSTRAVDLLNTVRNRALANVATQTYTAAGFATKNALIGAILKERRIEFLAEGKRWGDIHRWVQDPVFGTGGIPAKMANGFNGLSSYVCAGVVPNTGEPFIPYSDYRFLWPIPLQERNTNPIVEQNPGY